MKGTPWVGRAVGAALAAFPFVLASGGQKPSPVDANFKASIAFFAKFCVSCHQGDAAPGGVRFDRVRSPQEAFAQRHAFDRGMERMKLKQMPPPGALQPSDKQRADALLAIQKLFAKASPPPPDPGRVTMRRLNRAEYDNTVRDLLHIDLELSEDFPNDDVGYGFDNIGDVLTLSPLLFEKYLDAAERAAARAIALPDSKMARYTVSEMQTEGGAEFGGALGLFAPGAGIVDFKAPRAGIYRVKITAFGQQAGTDAPKMSVRLDRQELQVFEVPATQAKPASYELTAELKEGVNRLSAHFINDYYDPRHPDPKMRGDRNLFLEHFEITGPLSGGKGKPESHKRLILVEPEGKDPAVAARANLQPFLRRALRRPVTEAEVDRYVKLVQQGMKEGDSFEEGMRVAVAAALVSPHFLFRVELDGSARSTKARSLNDHELASRLSYFLWSSMPDAELAAAADKGRLKDPTVLKQQALRMLKDPRATALTENFAAQWLTLRKLEDLSPDPELFPTYGDALRADMEEEVRRFFELVVREDRSVVEFLSAPYAVVNGRLAQHYGIAGVSGEAFRKVPLKNGQRGGLLTTAAVLTVTSNPNRTSPVKRGKWVLENILGEPPPPPPPGLDSLEGDKDKVPAKTIKERMARHRRDPSCAVCHAKMDPLGIAFENYDAVGKWRLKDGRFAVDATGKTAEGEAFRNASDLKALLLKRKAQFVRTLAEKLLTYGLGRGVELSDRKVVDAIAKQCQMDGYRFSALVKGIVASEAFRKKRI